MKSATIRWIVILSMLAGVGIILTQIYMVRSAYKLQAREFDYKVKTALGDVAAKVMEYKHVQVPVYNPVEFISENYYIAVTNVFIEQDVLEHFLKETFRDAGINNNFYVSLYDCSSDTVEYQSYVTLPSASQERVPAKFEAPQVKRDNYYFSVYFPHGTERLASQLVYWIISSLVLLGILILLAYLLFIIFKQKRLSEVQKDFVNNMTHEFKTPLSSIQLAATVLKNPEIAHNPQRLLNYATIISKETAQLTSQVERVLQMAHAHKAEIEIKAEDFIWQDLLRAAVESFDQILAERQGKIILQLPPQAIPYSGDVLHLDNVVSNLLDNAIKYNENKPTITVSLEEKPKEIEVIVSDNGIGISPQYQKMLFKNFYRVPTGNVHNVKGFGLGLGYVRTIMKAHGGDVKCDSRVGEGSIFILTFPK